MSSDVVVIRRATVDDYDSVMNIQTTEHDYLPTLYHSFLHSRHYVFYVAEVNDTVVRGSGDMFVLVLTDFPRTDCKYLYFFQSSRTAQYCRLLTDQIQYCWLAFQRVDSDLFMMMTAGSYMLLLTPMLPFQYSFKVIV